MITIEEDYMNLDLAERGAAYDTCVKQCSKGVLCHEKI
jgi:hypothetical protein